MLGTEFDEDSDDDDEHPNFLYGVVSEVQKTGCKMLFFGDIYYVRYDGFLETWDDFRHHPDQATEEEEAIYQEIEVKAKLRVAPRTVVRGRGAVPASPSSSDSSGEGASSLEDEGPVVVYTWESDREDDESDGDSDGSSDGEGGVGQGGSLEEQFKRESWEDVHLVTDPRAASNSISEDITPTFRMPSFRDERLLSCCFTCLCT